VEARLEILSELVARLVNAGPAAVSLWLPLPERAAAREGKALQDVRQAFDALCRGEVRERLKGFLTFQEFCK
jgi:hypothetical protein